MSIIVGRATNGFVNINVDSYCSGISKVAEIGNFIIHTMEVVDMIAVYDGYFEGDGDVIARVRYNNNLDRWNGRNWSCGDIGHHKGLTRLKDGRFVLIFGSEWTGERDYAEIISEKEALQEIFKSGNDKLLKKYFPNHVDDDEEEDDDDNS